VLNWLYAVGQTEMTIALLTAGIDPGVGMFHVDMPNRPSLTLDAIEALRPYVDIWLSAYLADAVFANRDFTELRDGEVRLTHPLNAHLAHTATLWRQIAEPVAGWLKASFMRAAETALAQTRQWQSQGAEGAQQARRAATNGGRSRQYRSPVPPLAPLLPAFISSVPLRDEPVPPTCRECGRAMTDKHRTYCSRQCAAENRAQH
jgi:hypothetical protein